MRSVPIPVPETNWTLIVNGDRITGGTASPGHGRELAAGLLLAEGFVRRRDELVDVTVHDRRLTTTLDSRVADEAFTAAVAERRHRHESGCGLLHYVACEPDALARSRPADVPDQTVLGAHLRRLFDACSSGHPGGGVHAASAIAGDGRGETFVDVSRHAAVEKAVGEAFLRGRDAPMIGLVLTARISGRIALTAARSGVGWVASRSVPTTLAVAIAARAGLTLVARAGSRDVHTFAPTDRQDEA